MLEIIFWLLLFALSIFVLVKASDYFTDAAESIGIYFRLPPFVVGVTIVAIGTSLPELVSSVIAVLKGSSEIVAGNVIGSNIANIFLVLGVSAVVAKNIRLFHELIRVDLPVLLGSSFLLALAVIDGIFSFPEAIASLLLLLVYLLYSFRKQKEHLDKEIKREIKGGFKKSKSPFPSFLILAASALFIYFSANYTIVSIIKLSKLAGIAKEIIAVTAVAFGTSLPELMVTFSAARKGKPEIAVGNILGSNIFNSLGVMGISALFGPLAITKDILMFSLPAMLAATLLYSIITQDKEITKWEGWMLVIFYAFFISKAVGLF